MMCLSLKIKWDIVLCIYPGDFREDGLDKYKGKAARLRKGLSFGSKIRAEGFIKLLSKRKKVMETWRTPDGRNVEVHYWKNIKTGEIWSHK